jgi:hypothetical protein
MNKTQRSVETTRAWARKRAAAEWRAFFVFLRLHQWAGKPGSDSTRLL